MRLFSSVLMFLVLGLLIDWSDCDNLRSETTESYNANFTDFKFTDKKDLSQFINSYFKPSEKLFTQEYWAGEVEIGPITVYPNYKVFQTPETGSLQRMFYLLVSPDGKTVSNPDPNTPLIMWMQGGPGCGGWFASAVEMGPFRFVQNTSDPNDIYLINNEYTWSKDYYMLFIDQPIGAGLSTVILYTNSTEIAVAVVEQFLIKFFTLYPKLQANDFYIFGESFGGHYIPAVTARLVSHSLEAGCNPIISALVKKLKGIGIGDGWTDPKIQGNVYGQYLYSAGVASTFRKEKYKLISGKMQENILAGNYYDATNYFYNYDGGTGPNGKIRVTHTNLLNVRQYFQDYPSQIALRVWLKQQPVYEAFQVPKEVVDNFAICNNVVYHKFWADISHSHANNITYLLEYGLDVEISSFFFDSNSLQVLLYEGQVDPDVPTNGLFNFIQTLQWSQMYNFRMASKNMWYKNYDTVKPWGFSKVYSNFKIVEVYDAGHLVPHDQGEASKVMVDMFINKEWN